MKFNTPPITPRLVIPHAATMTRVAGLILFFLCLATPPVSGQQLQWKLSPGQTFQVTYEQTVKITTKVSDRTTITNSLITLTFDWTVLPGKTPPFTIRQSLVSMAVSVSDPAAPSKGISFDTQKKDQLSKTASQLRDQVQPLIGLPFDVTLSPQGKIISVDVPEQTQKVLQTLPDSLKLQSLFSEKGMDQLMGVAASALPEKPVKKGDRWKTEHPFENAFGPFIRTRQFTYQGPQTTDGHQLALLTFQTTLRPSEKSNDTSPPTFDFSESGTMKFDLKKGLFTETESSSTTHSSTKYRDKTIQTTIENSSKMTLVEQPKTKPKPDPKP